MIRALVTILSLLLFTNLQQQGAECSRSEQTETALAQILENRGSPTVRPDGPNGGDDPVVVNVTYWLKRIVSLDEESGRLTTTGGVTLFWRDPRLAFDRDSAIVRLEASQIWTPDIEVYDSDSQSMKNLNRKDHVLVYPSGEVNYIPQVVITTFCDHVFENFIVVQHCTVRFGSWTYNGYDLDVQTLQNQDLIQGGYVPSGRWTVRSTSNIRNVTYYPCCAEPYPTIDYTFTLIRS